jgi:formylglycine-generating enzyme required for sulfatase activity
LHLFQRFRNEHEYFKDWARTRDCPVLNVSWFEAAAFCNWLTKRDGMADEDLCYKIEERDGKIVEVQIAPDAVQRRGYRLPTDAEWEYACRAGAQTRYSFGDSEEMAKHYAWFALNAQSTTHAVGTLKPNRLGLFDMHGNAAEWCQGVFVAPPDNKGEVVEEPADTLIVTERVPRPLRDSNFATAFDRLGSSSVSWPDALGRIAAESGEMRSGRNRCGFRVGRTMTAPPKS